MNLTDAFLTHPELLGDEKKLKSILNDFYSGDRSKINRMMKAHELGIVEALSKGENVETEKNRIIDRLVDLHDMRKDRAIDAIAEWSNACTASVLSAYKGYKDAEEKKTAEKQREENERKEQELVEGQASEISINYDDYERYYNLDLSKGEVVYGIPCGVGKSDHGFIVKGTGHEDINEHELFPSVHALVYNFLIRDSHISKEAYPQYIKKTTFNHELDYANVYRFIMILVDLLKPNGETLLQLNVIGDKDEFAAAVDILNEYLGVFSRLTKSEPCSLRVEINSNAKTIAVDSKADYYVVNHKSDQGLRRRPRYGKRINYSLSLADKEDLEFLLREISPFTTFKKGQFNALCSVMNANNHAVCIMPTGSGKSLIYYLACILQPQVVFVVSPTNILIRDQIRNLKKYHHFDNVTHLDLRNDNDFSFFRPGTNLIFLTPATFQNRNLFGIFQRLKKEISYVVLDEIHCLSNWGHDFRPEYLMLSRNMIYYLEDARYLGFTATANYTVAQDIQKQLGIPYENFFSPILFEKYNVRYDFRVVDSTEEMYIQIKSVAGDIIRRNERALVFVKSEEIASKVADAIGYEADVFDDDRPESYSQFVDGLCNILVTSEELGIGVNLPNVNCTVHFGIPVSKSEFVQEIGRAGRADERVTSYVIYLNPTEDNIPGKLLRRDTVIDNLPHILSSMNNDYSDVYHKMNCGADTSDILYERLIDMYSDFHAGKKTVYTVSRPTKGIEQFKQLIYMLFVVGYVKDWYTYRAIGDTNVELIVDICSMQHTGHKVTVLDDESMLNRMKTTARYYFSSMDNDRESMFKVSKAVKIEDIIKVYVTWYYDKFLYHHKEQFLDCLEFIISNKACETDKIAEDIEGYFTLPFIQIKEDEEYYSNMSFAEISKQIISGVGKNTLSNIERLNSNNYSYKLDYMLFACRWEREGRFDINRLERLWQRLSDDEKTEFFKTMAHIYTSCTTEAKLDYLNYVDNANNLLQADLTDVMNGIYKNNRKDVVFYGIMAKKANKRFAAR